MPYQTTWTDQGIEWIFRDYVTAAEIAEANDEFYRDERSDNARYQLIDASRVTGVEWSDRDIGITAGYDIGADRIIKNIRVAYVATDPIIIAKLEKYIEISRRLNSSWQFQGFRELGGAQAWAAAEFSEAEGEPSR